MKNKGNIRNVICIMLFSYSCTLLSQISNLGVPAITNYSKEEYRSGTQNWDAGILESGQIIFANNSGLLLFNGSDWTSLATPRKTIARSLEVSKDESRIWVGGQDEIGYYSMVNDEFEFFDVKKHIPDEFKSLEDVWEIVSIDDLVYFRSRDRIYQIDDEKIEVVAQESGMTFIQAYKQSIFYNAWNKGLQCLTNGKKTVIDGAELLAGQDIIEMLVIDDQFLLFLTESNGIYKLSNDRIENWKTNSDDFLTYFRILSGHYLKDKKSIAVGTGHGGVILFDLEGKARFVLNKSTGLQNNTVRSITSDKNSNLWLGTDNGIDRVDLSNDNLIFYPDGNLEGALFDVEEWNGNYYFATTNGVYKIKKADYYNLEDRNAFRYIENTSGQSWGLDVVQGQLFAGHNNGVLQIGENDVAKNISNITGSWKFESLAENLMIAGKYNGIELFENTGNNNWQSKHKYENFIESARIMFLDRNNDLWISHPYKGVFRISFDKDYNIEKIKAFTKADGIEDLNNCYIHEIQNAVFVSNDSLIYRYSYEDSLFYVDTKLNELFKNQNAKRFFDKDYGVWYITDKEFGLLEIDKSGLDNKLEKRIYYHGASSFVGGFENIFPIDEREAFLCLDKGILHSSFKVKELEGLEVKINSVKSFHGNEEKIIFNGYQNDSTLHPLESNFNDLKFEFVSDQLEGKKSNIKYSYKLEGFEEEWSDWESLKFKEYTNLAHGNYSFQVRASAYQNQESSISAFDFEINPPWYLSWIMKLLYAVLFCAAIVLLVFVPTRKIKKEKELIEFKHKKTEAKVEDLKHKNLENKIKYQNNELANLTMHLLQKSETMSQIQKEIENVMKRIKNPDAKKEMKKVVSLINSDNRLEEEWTNFSYHFDKVHHDFLKRIKTEFPKLSSTDLKLCAYLRLNLTTKEIAPLLNISTRGVEISRYRLRKKLELVSGTNLNTFMISF